MWNMKDVKKLFARGVRMQGRDTQEMELCKSVLNQPSD
jgi:hypothetical protein